MQWCSSAKIFTMKTACLFIIALLWLVQSLSDAEGTIMLSASNAPDHAATAGESYSLECNATVTGSNNPPTIDITWSHNGDTISSDTVSAHVSVVSCSNAFINCTVLSFSPLKTSHAGPYECRASLGNEAVAQNFTVRVNLCSKLWLLSCIVHSKHYSMAH